MILFLKLFLAHCLGDFLFQPDSWVKDKETNKERSSKLYLHILSHFALSLLVVFDYTYIYGILVIVVLHYLIDLLKLYTQSWVDKRIAFGLDQLLHIIVLLIVANSYDPTLGKYLGEIEAAKVIPLLLAIILLTTVSSTAIKIIISEWNPENKITIEESLKNAGSYIGMLERLFVFGFVVTDHFEAIGLLLAAKSIFRFGDLTESKSRELTEYFLIGTLLSFGIALLIALLYEQVAPILLTSSNLP